jgi:hypothetical protein
MSQDGSEKREENRHSLKLPVLCRPLLSDPAEPSDIEIWTNDVHPKGAGLNWLISSKPQVCPTCGTLVRDLACAKDPCPYRSFKEVLMDCGWLQIHGLNRVPGWKGEDRVLGKVVWFKLDQDGINFQFGVEFNRQRPAIESPPIMEERVEKETADGHFQKIGPEEIRNYDFPRWETTIQESQKKIVVMDEDRAESTNILAFAKSLGYAGKAVPSDREGLAEVFLNKPKIVFVNPVVRGAVRMENVEKIRDSLPESHILLILDEKFRDQVLDDPSVRLAGSIFLKPLDLARLKEFIEQI